MTRACLAAIAMAALTGGCTLEVAPQHNTYVYEAPAKTAAPADTGLTLAPMQPPDACCTVDGDDCSKDPFPQLVTTHDFEANRLQLATTDVATLEMFLRDLNQRKDYALACHDGRSTETSEYLWHWVERVVGELQHRGYTMDGAGNLYDGERVVALR